MEYIEINSEFPALMPQLLPCTNPRMIRWTDFNTETDEGCGTCYGIQLGAVVICACCGKMFSIEELNAMGKTSYCTNWVSVADTWYSFDNELEYCWE